MCAESGMHGVGQGRKAEDNLKGLPIAINVDKVNSILNISSDYKLMAIIILGYEDLNKTKNIEKTERINANKKIHIWIEK